MMDIEKWIDRTFKLRPAKGSNVRHVEFEWNKIDDQVYLGTNACCRYHFDHELLSQGVNVDISLESEEIDMAQGIDAFLWLPTVDHTAPSQENLRLGVQMIHECIRQNRILYIHCKNGHGRAPTLLAAYYISIGRSVDEAIKFVESRRHEAHIEDSQRRALEQYAQNLK